MALRFHVDEYVIILNYVFYFQAFISMAKLIKKTRKDQV